MCHNGDGLHFVLYVCAVSKAGQWGSQEQYQRTLPPREMSSRSRRLWDCCRHPSSLWMSASLTGQLAYMAPLTTQLHFQLLFINFPPSFFPPDTAPLSGKDDDRHVNCSDSFLLRLWGKYVAFVRRLMLRWTSGEWIFIHAGVRLFCPRWHLQDLWNMQTNMLLSVETAEHYSFPHK